MPTLEELNSSLGVLGGPGPTDLETRAKWLKSEDVLAFLHWASSGEVPIYISGPILFAYCVLVSKRKLRRPRWDDLLAWNFSIPGGWGFGYSTVSARGRHRRKPMLFELLDGTSSLTLDREGSPHRDAMARLYDSGREQSRNDG